MRRRAAAQGEDMSKKAKTLGDVAAAELKGTVFVRGVPPGIVTALDGMAEKDRRSRNEEVVEILDRVTRRWRKGELLDEILPYRA